MASRLRALKRWWYEGRYHKALLLLHIRQFYKRHPEAKLGAPWRDQALCGKSLRYYERLAQRRWLTLVMRGHAIPDDCLWLERRILKEKEEGIAC